MGFALRLWFGCWLLVELSCLDLSCGCFGYCGILICWFGSLLVIYRLIVCAFWVFGFVFLGFGWTWGWLFGFEFGFRLRGWLFVMLSVVM